MSAYPLMPRRVKARSCRRATKGPTVGLDRAGERGVHVDAHLTHDDIAS